MDLILDCQPMCLCTQSRDAAASRRVAFADDCENTKIKRRRPPSRAPNLKYVPIILHLIVGVEEGWLLYYGDSFASYLA